MAKTWATLREEIKDDMNLHGEDFVSDTELLAWANDGIEQAEKEIVSIYDKYFETDAYLTIVAGTTLYSLPSGILAHKITHIEFDDGSDEYEIKYWKRKQDKRYLEDSSKYLRYRLRNDSSSGMQIEFFPAPSFSSSTAVKVYFIREAARLVLTTDTIEIPIADAFIKQYIKDQVRGKELGPMWDHGETQALQKQRALMIEALQGMVIDDSRGEIEPDQSSFDDFYDEYEVY